MYHILVAPNGTASAKALGIPLDTGGRSLYPLPQSDALAACTALQDAGFAAVLASPPEGWAMEDWTETLVATPEVARLFLDWQVAHPTNGGRHAVAGLMAAMRALWPEAWTALESVLDADPSAYDFADTFRVAPQDDTVAVEAYRLVERSGCCGSLDTTVEVGGRVFLAGFNHGH
jgi:hypothetical protein